LLVNIATALVTLPDIEHSYVCAAYPSRALIRYNVDRLAVVALRHENDTDVKS